jgi:hypothetical protein
MGVSFSKNKFSSIFFIKKKSSQPIIKLSLKSSILYKNDSITKLLNVGKYSSGINSL